MLGKGRAATDFGMALIPKEALHASKSSMLVVHACVGRSDAALFIMNTRTRPHERRYTVLSCFKLTHTRKQRGSEQEYRLYSRFLD